MRTRSLLPRALSLVWLLGAGTLTAAACSGPSLAARSPSSPQPSASPPAKVVARAVPDAGLADAVSADASAVPVKSAGRDAGAAPDTGATPDAGEKTKAAANEEPAACPEGMILIDGDYCTQLELKCLKSHYAPQNKKTICHEFQVPSVCTGKKVKKRYCIDRYEYANKKGERPVVMNNFPQAQRLCAAQGKRVCTESEWTMACEGPSYKPYPYGYVRDPKKCRGDRAYRFPNVKKMVSKDKAEAQAEIERLWDGAPSGSQPDCVSDYGVYDMPGNADELAASESSPPRSKFDNVTTGGPWLDGVRNQCRPKIYEHNEGFVYYYLSFRCCAEADGKPTDPRAPKQIQRKEKWKNRPPQ